MMFWFWYGCTSLSGVATTLSVAMLGYTLGRKHLVVESGEWDRDRIAQITMQRAIRQEVCFCLAHALIFWINIYGMEISSLPLSPPSALRFFFWSALGRTLASVVLFYLSLRDLQQRAEIARELDRLQPETPPSAIG